ncbi:hypothetical protein C9933_00965 [Methylophaga nitratireducenticrescens]|nr:hypothetical protein C9933_00965 [Methylophaga nitratireducenticrescens]
MKTIRFEDKGQDFLEWDLNDDNVVIDSRPFQSGVWRRTLVHEVKEGIRPTISHPRDGVPRLLNYKIISIREN